MFPVAIERILFKCHYQAFFYDFITKMSKFSKEYVKKGLVLTLKPNQNPCILKRNSKIK